MNERGFKTSSQLKETAAACRHPGSLPTKLGPNHLVLSNTTISFTEQRSLLPFRLNLDQIRIWLVRVTLVRTPLTCIEGPRFGTVPQ